jgi:hypothetical protein
MIYIFVPVSKPELILPPVFAIGIYMFKRLLFVILSGGDKMPYTKHSQ